ncbi:MAG: hypothetical protein M0Z33_06800 [Actinomycetota bacterium]|nr:hypothetical protein [Actinomycetota bacterium]
MSAAWAAAAPVASVLGIGPGIVRAVVDTVLGEITRWVASGAGTVLSALGGLLGATTTPVLGTGFLGEYATMTAISAALSLPLLLLSVIRSVVHQDLAGLLRSALLRLPVAILLAGAAVGVVSLCLQLADATSGALLAVAGHPVDGFVGALVADLTLGSFVTGGGPVLGGFAALALALVATAVALLLWVELAVRAAAVAAATLFVPLALAGLVWPATAHWARRLGETILALVFAKVAVAGVLALAGTTFVQGSGASGAVEGVALLLLATFAPFAVLRLVPVVEAGAVSHLEGTGRRVASSAARAPAVAWSASSFAAGALSGATGGGLAGAPGGRFPAGAAAVVDDVPGLQIVDLSSPEVQELAARLAAESRRGSGREAGVE